MAPSSRADGAPSSQPPIAHLQELLGVSVDVASRLLADSDGDLQTAVAMHFATRNLAGPSSSNQPGSDRERLQRSLREMGFEITLSRAAYFLGQAGGSVEGAAELYLSVPSVDPAAGDHGPAPVRNNRERRTSQPRAAPQAAAPRAAQAQVQEANVAGGEPEEDDSTDVDSEDESSGRGSAGENADADENGSDADEPEGATSAEFEDQSDSEDVYEESEPEAAFASAEERYDAGMGLTVLDTSPAGPGPELPSLARVLFAAAARRDSSRGLTKAKHLPLPKLRKADGKLFSEDHTQIPEVIRPSGAVACCIAALSELCLGSVLLPVHANNAAALEELYSRGSMVWDSNSELGYSYCVPIPPSTASYAGELACDFSILSKNASSLAEAMRGRIPVQLCLGDEALDAAHTPAPNYKSMSPHSAPIVVVRPARGTWENSFLAALACLDLRGLVTARFTLAGPRQGDEAGPSSAHAAHGVRAEVHLTAAALRDLFFDEDTSHFEEHFDEAAQKRKNSKGPGNPRRIRGDGELLCTLLSALLLHGSGLSLGPDSDGLLNYNDPGMVDERAAIMASPPAEVRGQFDVSRVLESVARKDEAQAAKAQAPGVLLTRPKQYQLAGLQWMLDREEYGDALGRGQALLHPAWVQLVTPSGQLLYLHRATPHVLSFNFYSAPPPGTCGGCIADEMGLGKSLQTLMLICSRPPPANWAVTDLEAYDSQEVAPIKTTLLIAPATLLAQWEDEIKAHLVPGALRYGRLEPNPQKFDAGVNTRRVATHRKKTVPPRCKLPDGDTAPLHTLDLALLSYEHLRDHSRGDSLNLEHFGFWRVCLDEAQMISNTNSVAALMASSLWRRHAWVITGTPITSKLDEIQGLLTFLTLEPMDAMRYWRSLVGHECDQFSAAGLLALRGLLRGVMLRRSKAQVSAELSIPPCTREDRTVALTPPEFAIYQRKKREFLHAVNTMRSHTTAAGHASSAAQGRAHAALVALRQSTCHPQVARQDRDAIMASKRLSLEEILGRLMAQNYQEWDQALRRVAEAQILHEVIVAVKAGCSVYSAIEGILSQVRANARAARVTDLSAALDVREGSSGLLVNASKLQAVEHSLMSKQEEEDNALEGLRAEYMEQVEAVAADLQAAEQEAEQPGNGKEKKQKQPKKARKGHIMTEAARRVGPKPQHPLEIQVERTEARMRWRSWKRLELNALELAAYLTSDEGGRKLRLQYGRNGKSELEEVRKPNGGEEEEPSAKARGKRLASSPTTQGEKRAKLSANGNGTAPLGESEKVVKELHDVRMELGLVNDSLGLYAAGPSIRRSRRQAGIDADSDAEVEIDPAELAQQLENAKVFIRTFKEAIRHKDCQEKAKKVQDTADAEANELYGRLKFVKAQSSSKGSDVEQTNPTSCPICFDDLADVRQTITRCNHRFCSACIHEALIAQGAQATCPLCRTPLTEADLFDAVSEEEAAAQREMQARNQQAAEEYGSKIAVMLEELAIMRDFDPGAKAIVFSSWGRLLRLVGEALTANSVGHTTLAGVTLAKREEALRLFAADPNCTVLTVLLSSSSGAAGLTLTSASVAFLMEPCINPGLEAQASARIFRLGQTRPTRVIRLVAQDTVDLAVLEQQKRKAESGSAGMLADEADQGTLVTLAERLRDMP